MKHNEKLVDSTVVDRLTEGSFEAQIERVEQAVANSLHLFNAEEGGLHSWTYPNHVVVVNEHAEFFRAEYTIGDDGEVELGNVERVEVPVKEAKHLGSEARGLADDIVGAVFDGDDDRAEESFQELFNMVANGVRITAESVEDDFTALEISESAWMRAVDDNAVTMRAFIGAAANRDMPKPRFEAMLAADELSEADSSRYRKVVGEGLRRLRTTLEDLNASIALARTIDEGYTLRDGDEMAASHFIEFAGQLGDDLDAMMGVVENAIAVAGDGDLKSLARTHDGVAELMGDAGLAAAFAEKFSTKFTAPEAA